MARKIYLGGNIVGTTDASDIASGTLNAARIADGSITDAKIAAVSAGKLTGTIASARISGSYTGITGTGTLNAGAISSGFGNINIGSSTFTGNGSGLSSLPAGNLTGTIADARIPNLAAGKITSGTFALARIPTLDAGRIPNLAASKITSGTFALARIPTLDAGRIPNLDAGKITSGTFNAARIPNLDAGKITSGTIANARISGAYSGITTLTTSSTIRSTGGQVRGASLRTDTSLFFNTTGFPRFETSGSSVLLRGSGFLDMRFDSGFRLISGNLINQSNLTFLNSTDTVGSPANMFMSLTGRVSRSISSQRYKRDVQDADVMPSVLDVRPVTFRMRSDISPGGVMYGVIAEELDELGLTHLVEYADGQPESVHYSLLAVALIPHVRDLRDRIAALEGIVNAS